MAFTFLLLVSVGNNRELFRLFIDLTYPIPHQNDITRAIQTMAVVASYYFVSESSRALVLQKNIRPGIRSTRVRWDTIYVTLPIARTFRLHIILRLQDTLEHACIDWIRVVHDIDVFNGHGYAPVHTVDQRGTIRPPHPLPQKSVIRPTQLEPMWQYDRIIPGVWP